MYNVHSFHIMNCTVLFITLSVFIIAVVVVFAVVIVIAFVVVIVFSCYRFCCMTSPDTLRPGLRSSPPPPDRRR